jgi:NitT/TauT family transport system permease protein
MPMPGFSSRLVSHAAGAIPGGLSSARQFWFDTLAFCIIAAVFVFFAWGTAEITAPLSSLEQTPISLNPHVLPEYALRTTLRMLLAVLASLFFTLTYATLAAKSYKAGQILIPILDILQSVPVLGYISFTVTAFIALFPHSTLGVECAAIFAIFTSQAWNMAFSLYQSLKTVPHDIDEAAVLFRLSGWQKFWRMELPFAMPGLIWNTMMSMSGGWFFVVASEAITVGNQKYSLPGIGSYIALAIERQDIHAIFCAILTMVVVILLYDQLLFRPLVAWSDKFSYELTASQNAPESWLRNLFAKSRIIRKLFAPVGFVLDRFVRLRLFKAHTSNTSFFTPREAQLFDYVWYSILALIGLIALRYLFAFIHTSLDLNDIREVSWLTFLTLIRVLVLIALASIIWVPLGVLIGLSPRLTQLIQPLAQFLAAFPANLLFPLAVVLISRYDLNPDIWLSPLMILGTQWYILFNVIAGASSFPNDLKEAARNFHIKGWLWWRRVMLPGIFPYFLTGAITASGGAWNASIVAEAVSWGNKSYNARGLGSYIAQMTAEGDFAHIALGVGMMALVVVTINKLFWRPLYDIAARELRFD